MSCLIRQTITCWIGNLTDNKLTAQVQWNDQIDNCVKVWWYNVWIKYQTGNGNLLLISIQSELSSLDSAVVHWPPLYSLTKHARFCEPGVVTFSRLHFLFVCRRTSRKLLGKLVGFSSVNMVKDVYLIQHVQCNLKSVSIFSYNWLFFCVKNIRVYHALLYSRQTCEILRARDCDFLPTIYLISLSENWSKTIEGKLAGFLSVKDVDLIQSNLKSVSIFSYYWFIFWVKTYRVCALCIDPTGRRVLSNRYGIRTTQHIHVRSDNECWIIPYLHVVQKSVEFSGVGSLTH